MTTTIDFNSLEASQGPRVVLMPSTQVGQSTVGGVFDDFSAFSSVYVTADASCIIGNQGQPSLTVTVEHSDDNSSWSTAATLGYGPDGKQSALVSSPKQYFRVTAAPGGSSVWQVVSVTAAPTYLDAAGGGGGGSQLVTEGGYYSGDPVAAGQRPPWNIHDAGDAVLDTTNTIEPVAPKDGLYAISAEVVVVGATVAGDCNASLIFDYGNDGAIVVAAGVQDSLGNTFIFVSGSYVLAAAEKIRLTVTTDADADTVELRNALVSRVGPA